jgi:hypothetical protein
MYGELLHCYSDCNKPKTKFSKGIHGAGKIMAKEYTGVLSIMAPVLWSSKGREILCQNKQYFGTKQQLNDWIMLIKTMLQWGEWLKSDQMEKKYLLYLIKKVENHTKYGPEAHEIPWNHAHVHGYSVSLSSKRVQHWNK